MIEEAEKEEGDFDKFANAAMRNPKRKVYDQILAALLISANGTGEPLRKIQKLCEAAFFVKDKTNLDMPLIEVANQVSSALLKAEVRNNRSENFLSVEVPWSFPRTEENWNKYIEPWQFIDLRYFPFHTTYREKHYPFKPDFNSSPFNDNSERQWEERHEVTHKAHKEILALPNWQKFFIQCEVLSVESFKALKGEFENYYLLKLLSQELFLAEQVSSQVYTEMWKSTHEPGEKETEEAENEDQMG